jgi:7,8-dihydropterin-6-yl-methyl-4-(beta-D-ribofuranosyl)aminobenzene 5'-phosphate synthase
MTRITRFGQVHGVTITVLVDNRADLLVQSTDSVKRFTKQPLLAEHGFAALIDLKDVRLPKGSKRILWDAGMSQTVLLENARRMELDWSTVDAIALSHGHGDHTAAVTDVIRAVGAWPRGREWQADIPTDDILEYARVRRVPVVAHPAAFRERWVLRKDGTRYGPIQPPSRAEWEATGAQVILSEGPYELAPGCWTTGSVPRRSFEGAGVSSSRAYREGSEFLPDDLQDDQSIVLNVADKGLVVLSGCAHAGIVNTVRYAQEISGVDKVWAILGGFHLAPAGDAVVQRTIDALAEMAPQMIVPSHCTGFRAMAEFARRMPDQFVLGAVGTKYLF